MSGRRRALTGSVFLKSFARNQRGIAAVEFALVVPMLLVFYIGGAALSDAVAARRKTMDATAQITNVVAQYTTMQASDVQGLLAAATQIMSPYPTGSLTEAITLVGVDASGAATVTWSQSYNGGTALQKGASVTLPASMVQPNMSVIWVQTHYVYTSTAAFNLIPSFTFSDQLYSIPRSSVSIPCSTC